MEPHEARVEAGAVRLGNWIHQQVLDRWPSARVTYCGRALNDSRYWRVDPPAGEPLWFAATEPVLLEPTVSETPLRLARVEWIAGLAELVPDGLLVTASGRLFMWDREKDRGTRMLDWA